MGLGLGLAVLSAAGCFQGQASAERVIITGSSTMAPVVAEIAREFEVSHPGIRVDVQSGGSSRGLLDVVDGTADLGMASRKLRPDDPPLKAYLLAHDGVAVIVHTSNPIAEVSRAELADIYTGKLATWAALDGPRASITVVHKAEGRATLDVFLEYLQIPNSTVRPDVVIGDNEQGIKTVAGDKNAIGYVSIGAAEASAANGIPVKLIRLDGVAPTSQTVVDGTFPLVRQLNLVSKNNPSRGAQQFLDFALSNLTKDLIRAQHFVPVGH